MAASIRVIGSKGVHSDLDQTQSASGTAALDPNKEEDRISSTPPRLSADQGPPPDGGLRAWSQVLVGVLVNALTWGYTASFGVYQLHYTETLRLPPSQISWIGSTQIFFTFFFSAFSGRAADAGYARHAVFVGTTLVLVGTFMTSFATKYWQIFLAQGICTGLGMGVMFTPAIAVVGTYFVRRKTTALAICASGTGFGSMVFAATVQYLAPQIGFPWAVRCSAFVALFFSIIINILFRPRLSPRKSGPVIEWEAFREPAYTIFSIGMFFILWALYFGFFYINTFARSTIGFSTVDSVSLILIVNAAGVLIRPVLGYLADRYFGPINTLIPSSFLLSLTFYCWAAIHSRGGMYAFAVVYGLASGATQGIFFDSLASLTKDLSKRGTRYGMVCSLLAFATLAGPSTAGALVQTERGNYIAAQMWGGTVVMFGTLTVAAARVWESGWKWGVKI